MPGGNKITQVITAILATGFALANGILLGWSAPMQRAVQAGDLGFRVTEEEFSWVSSALPLGGVIACIPAGFVMEAIGRKLSGILLSVLFIIGWIIIIFGVRLLMLILGRFILGMAAGATCTIIPIYVGEISQKEIRGALNSFFQLQITLGILFIYIVGAFANPLWTNIISSIVPVIFGIAMIFLPETPLFWMKKGREEKAAKSLRCLRGKDYDIKPEMDAIREDIGQLEQTSMIAAFKNPAFRMALYITVTVMIFQQVSGINAVLFHTTHIFHLAGSTLKPKYCTIIVGIVQVVATFVSLISVDRLGRRVLLLISATMVIISTLGLGIFFFEQQKDPFSVEVVSWFPLFSLCFYIIGMSIGYGPVPWILIGELFPIEGRGVGGALAALTSWLFSFIVSKSYPSLSINIGEGETFWLFAIFSVVGLVFILFIVPETKTKTFVEIQQMLKDRN